MEIIKDLMECLERSPAILKEFVGHIPERVRRDQRKPGKWTIHENVCHLALAEQMIYDRFERIKLETMPVFSPYLPGKTVSDKDLNNLNLVEQLDVFEKKRSKTIALLRSYEDSFWDKPAQHQEYYNYNARILLRHTLMHDHFHMYRIEELWLTKPEFL